MEVTKSLDPKLVYSGSVKNIYAVQQNAEKLFLFQYSDRYSVFDWGEMPDSIPGKGESLAKMAKCFFQILESPIAWKKFRHVLLSKTTKNTASKLESVREIEQSPELVHALDNLTRFGLGTHYLGESQESCILVRPVSVIRPNFIVKENRYDYQMYQTRPSCTLVPLEVVFRFQLTSESSLLKRYKKLEEAARDPKLGVKEQEMASRQLEQIKQDLKLTKAPYPGQKFVRPLVEFTTKLEPTDRHLSYDEAFMLAGLTKSEAQRLVLTTELVAMFLQHIFNALGIELQDGKLEFAFSQVGPLTGGDRLIQLVDSIGPDELRLSKKGEQLSKEVLREAYRQTDWYHSWEMAKKSSAQTYEGKRLAKESVGNPTHLHPEVIARVASMYRQLAKSIDEQKQQYLENLPEQLLLSREL